RGRAPRPTISSGPSPRGSRRIPPSGRKPLRCSARCCAWPPGRPPRASRLTRRLELADDGVGAADAAPELPERQQLAGELGVLASDAEDVAMVGLRRDALLVH